MSIPTVTQLLSIACAQGRIRRINISKIKRFQRGQDTDVFRRYPQPKKAHLSFSILYQDA